MSLITRMQKQTCVYWALESEESASADDFTDFGVPNHMSPIELSCRWEDIAENFIGKDGTTLVSKSKVYVGQDVDVGGILMLGELIDVTDNNEPKNNNGAYEIRAFESIPNLRATESLRIAIL